MRLSADTMEKQAHRHPEMTPEDYARLPELLAAPDLVVAGATPRHSVFVSPPDAQRKALSAVVKRVPNDAAYVVSFRRAGRKEIERLVRTGLIFAGLRTATAPDEE